MPDSASQPPCLVIRPCLNWPWPVRWALLLAYLGLVTWLSLAPASAFAAVPMLFRNKDKVVHFLFYGGLVSLGRWTLAAHWTVKPHTGLVVVGAIGYGALMEVLQGVIVSYGRSFEFGDIVANSLGALCFWWLSRFLFVAVSPEPRAKP